MSWVDQCLPSRLVVMQSNIVPTQCKVCLIKSEDTDAPILLPRASQSPIISIFIYFLPRTPIPAVNHCIFLLPGEAKFTRLYYFHISESLQVVVWHISNIFILFWCSVSIFMHSGYHWDYFIKFLLPCVFILVDTPWMWPFVLIFYISNIIATQCSRLLVWDTS